MKIGILTGGGDCPGLNAVIRAIVRKGVFHYADQLVGFMEGWRGVLEDMTRPLDLDAVAGILPRGGTILRTSGRFASICCRRCYSAPISTSRAAAPSNPA